MNAPELFEGLDHLIAASSPVDRAGLVVGLAARLAVLGAGLASGQQQAPSGDASLTVEEGARRLTVSKAWIYHNAKTLPFVARLGRRLVLSERGLERYLERLRKA